MKYPSTAAVKMATAETAGNALAKEVVKSAVVGGAEVNLNSHTAQQGVVRPAVKVKKTPKTPEEIARNIELSNLRKQQNMAKQELANIAKKEEAKLAKALKPLPYDVSHIVHCENELSDLLVHLTNNPFKIIAHELIPFTEPIIDMHTLKHIFGIELKKVKEGIKDIKDKLAGLHFNPNGRWDEYLSDIVIDEITGIIKAIINYGGLNKKDNTFFPSSWTIEKLLDEMQSALLNPHQIKQSGSRILFVGESSMGVRIEMVFEKTGKLVTAYPTLKK